MKKNKKRKKQQRHAPPRKAKKAKMDPSTDNKKPEEKTDPENDPVDSNLSADVPPAQHHRANTRVVRECKPNETALAKWWLDVLTFVAAVIVATIYYYQLKQMTIATQTAQNAVEATQDQMRLDQRSWIGIKGVHGTKPTSKVSMATFVDVTNTGHTPANNVIVYPSFMFALPGDTISFKDTNDAMRLGLLSPGTERTITFNASENKIVGKQPPNFFLSRKVYAFGKITYSDIFGRCHWVTYCAHVSNDWNTYQFCEEHNDTGDEICKDK
jgi:hypothetical protein